jgi:3-oxoadipate enol-lactonase
MEVRTEGARLYVEQHGSGPDVVLVHGRGQSSARVWRTIVPALQDEFRVTVFDQRGCARSTDDLGDQSVERHADDVIALMDALGIARTQLVGFSFGGLVAQEVAFRIEPRLDSLTLMCTTCGLRPETISDYLTRADRVEREGMEAYVEKGMSRVLSPRYVREEPEATAEYRRQFLLDDPRVYAEAMRAMTRWSGCAQLAKTTVPLMTIAADGDDSPITANRALAASEEIVRVRPDAQAGVIVDSRHYVQLEQREALLAVLLPFLMAHRKVSSRGL